VNRKIAPFVENISEATAACLVTMVQGNLLAITLGHWLVASQTCIVAGTVASGLLLIWRSSKPWMIASILGVVTAVVDYFVHPGQFGPLLMEAIVTGIGAGALSYLVGMVLLRARARRLGSPQT